MVKKPKKRSSTGRPKSANVRGKEANLRRYLPVLQQISKTKNSNRIQNILNELPNSGIRSLCECMYNVLYSKQISKKHLRQLKKLDPLQKQRVRALALAPVNKNFKEKRFLLRQAGGGLGSIIASVLPILISLFTRKS